MSDSADAGTVAAPAPVESTPAAPQPVTHQPSPGKDRSDVSPRQAAKQAAREGLREQGRQAYEQAMQAGDEGGEPATTEPEAPKKPTVDAHGRAHSPDDGKYLPENEAGEGEAAEEEAASSEAAATEDPLAEGGEAGEQDEGEEASSEAAEKRVRVELGDHPVGDGGLDAITVSSEKEAVAVRALVNGTYHRTREVQELKTKLTTLHTELDKERRARIEREATTAAQQRWMESPEYKAKVQRYREIHESVGREAASDYWQAQQSSLRAIIDDETSTRMAALEASESERAAQEWRDSARRRMDLLPEAIRALPTFDQLFQESLAGFEAAVERGVYDAELAKVPEDQAAEWLHRKFGNQFALRLRNEPDVVKAYKQQNVTPSPSTPTESSEDIEKRIERERKKAVEDFKMQAAQTRKDIPPHPLGGAGGETPSTISREEEQPDLNSMGPAELKKYHRTKARESARARFASA